MSHDAHTKSREAELLAILAELAPVFQRMCVVFRAQPEIATADLVSLRGIMIRLVDSLTVEIHRRGSAPS
jgi:hypothetical protein